jgi:RNA polymerase II-associated factor 1
MRYARPEFLNTLAMHTPLPMIVDAECGMPLDLGRWECLWEENVDDAGETIRVCISRLTHSLFRELNPNAEILPTLDQKDLLLLSDPSVSYTNGGPSGSSSGPSAPAAVHVPWLRKTEYLSREGIQRSSAQEPCVFLYQCSLIFSTSSFNSKHMLSDTTDVSRGAQIRGIEASFVACNDAFSITAIEHPNKPNVTAVDSFEIFPDADIWANAYDLFRFSERPGERVVDVCCQHLILVFSTTVLVVR